MRVDGVTSALLMTPGWCAVDPLPNRQLTLVFFIHEASAICERGSGI